MGWLIFGALLTICIATASLVKPSHVVIKFTKTPPVLARINTPSSKASESTRTIKLPTGDIYIIPPHSRGHFLLIYDWKVPIAIQNNSITLTIPKLAATDFASIPRPLHSLISPLSNSIYAAIVHDYLYRDPSDPVAREFSRKIADRVFYWAMRVRGVSRITAGIMYLGVRIGGTHSYVRTKCPE